MNVYHLSIIIPAYNEEKRIGRTIEKLIPYLEAYYKKPYEIVVVDDGSRDKTVAVIEDYTKKFKNLKIIQSSKNLGRGAAVRRGVLSANGELILETDADGSVDSEAIIRFADYLDAHPDVDVVIGSRNCQGAKILTPQSPLRVFLGYGFLMLASALFGWGITDYTLGFKMFKKTAAREIFKHQFDDRYVAEAEIIFAAKKLKKRLVELPVFWTDYSESKVRPLRDSWRSLKGVLAIVRRNFQGKYRKNDN